jgi:hypothetical protein
MNMTRTQAIAKAKDAYYLMAYRGIIVPGFCHLAHENLTDPRATWLYSSPEWRVILRSNGSLHRAFKVEE